MGMTRSEVESFLAGIGFVSSSTSAFGDSFELKLAPRWKISAFAAKEGNPFAGTGKSDSYDGVSFSLESRGTKYRCLSLNSLKQNAAHIVHELRGLSENDELLKCPKCNVRYVHVKEPSAGQRWQPFLSCDGMTIVGRGDKKHVGCDGTSHRIPAVVVYR